MEGKLRPGDKLPPERELAEMFGVSRTAVRDAAVVSDGHGLQPTAGWGRHGGAGERPMTVESRTAQRTPPLPASPGPVHAPRPASHRSAGSAKSTRVVARQQSSAASLRKSCSKLWPCPARCAGGLIDLSDSTIPISESQESSKQESSKEEQMGRGRPMTAS